MVQFDVGPGVFLRSLVNAARRDISRHTLASRHAKQAHTSRRALSAGSSVMSETEGASKPAGFRPAIGIVSQVALRALKVRRRHVGTSAPPTLTALSSAV